jgi:hypothetical protein
MYSKDGKLFRLWEFHSRLLIFFISIPSGLLDPTSCKDIICTTTSPNNIIGIATTCKAKNLLRVTPLTSNTNDIKKNIIKDMKKNHSQC